MLSSESLSSYGTIVSEYGLPSLPAVTPAKLESLASITCCLMSTPQDSLSTPFLFALLVVVSIQEWSHQFGLPQDSVSNRET